VPNAKLSYNYNQGAGWQVFTTTAKVDNNSVKAVLPVSSYTDSFQVKVEDNAATYDAGVSAPFSVKYIVITSPVAGQTLINGTTTTISWKYDPDKVTSMHITLSTDGGKSFGEVFTKSIPADQASASWAIGSEPDNGSVISFPSSTCILRIEDYVSQNYNDETGAFSVTGSAPIIYATVDWSIVQTKLLASIGVAVETTVTASVSVEKSASVQDSTASVSIAINGVSYPLAWVNANDEFVTTNQHKIPASAVTNGDMIAVTVTSGGKTYADSEPMPGGISLAADGSSVSWVNEGTADDFVLYPVDATDMPDISNPVVSSVAGLGGMSVSADLSSPVTVPQGSLTSGNTYEAEVIVQKDIPFPGAGKYSDLNVRQIFLKDYQKP
jgi:hypothetical protein